MPIYDYDCANCGRRFEVIHGIHADAPRSARCAAGARPQGVQRAGGPLQGLGLGEEGAPDGRARAVRRSRATRAGRDGGSDGGDEADGGSRTAIDGRCPSSRRAGRRERDEGQVRRRPAGPAGPAAPMPVRARRRLTGWPRRPTGSPSARRPRSWPPRTSTSRPATIGGWARAGQLQSIKLGGRRFVRRGEVRALVAAPRRVRAEDLQPGLFEDLGG